MGTIIVILVTAGATYYLTAQPNRPISLTPDVQRYVDARLTGSSSAEQELQGLIGRLTQMEAKLVEIEKIKANAEKLAGKSATIETAISEQRRNKDEVINAARTAELSRLRGDIATACAGVTVRPLQPGATSAPSRGAGPNRGQGGKTP